MRAVAARGVHADWITVVEAIAGRLPPNISDCNSLVDICQCIVVETVEFLQRQRLIVGWDYCWVIVDHQHARRRAYGSAHLLEVVFKVVQGYAANEELGHAKRDLPTHHLLFVIHDF